jgi:hypothetical protein
VALVRKTNPLTFLFPARNAVAPSLLRIAAILLLSLGFAGCYGTLPMKFYGGPARPKNEIAVLSESVPFQIKNVNGRPIDALTKDIQLLPGEYGIAINYYSQYQVGNTIYTNYSLDDYLCRLRVEPAAHYVATGQVQEKSWTASILNSDTKPAAGCELVPRRMGDQVFFDDALTRSTLVEYEVPAAMGGDVKSISLVRMDDKRHVVIVFQDGYADLAGKYRWTEKGKAAFGSINTADMALVYWIPKDLADDASLGIYPPGAMQVNEWTLALRQADKNAVAEWITLRPLRRNDVALREEALAQKKKELSQSRYYR